MSYLPKNPSLNSEQLLAATSSISTPLRIVAGAGTGKTTTLVERVHYLLSLGVEPHNILPISFTKPARNELRTRLEGTGVNPVTFHVFSAKILHSVPHDNELSWLNPSQKLNSVKELCFSDPTGATPSTNPVEVQQFLKSMSLHFQTSSYEEFLTLSANETIPSPPTHRDPITAHIAYNRIRYGAYYRHCVRNNIFCHDTSQYRAAELLHSGEHSANLPTHLLVDEFQDVNDVQYSICKDVAPTNLTIVGDSKQCIYRWRGSDPSIFSNISDDYPSLISLPLTNNYRSSPQIVDLANYVGSHINDDLPLVATKPDAAKPSFTLHSDRDSETRSIAGSAILSFEAGESTAILCRSNYTLKNFNKALMTLGHLPVLARGSFWEQPRPSAMLDLLNLLVYKKDDYFKSLMSRSDYKFPDLGSKTLEFLDAVAKHHDLSLWDTLHAYAKSELSHALSNLDVSVPGPSRTIKLSILSENLLLASRDVSSFLKGGLQHLDGEFLTFSTFLGDPKPSSSDDDEPTDEPRDTFHENLVLSYIPNFDSIEDFLLDAFDLENPNNSRSAVNLLTVHSAKGLEFDTVYVPRMTCGTFPTKFKFTLDGTTDCDALLSHETEHYDEETCCLYVALTRARLNVYLSGYYQGPSRGKKPPVLGYTDCPELDFFRSKDDPESHITVAFFETDLLSVDPHHRFMIVKKDEPYV